jgi:Uncharacterized protein conserved in bacteria (DUF2225)
MVRNVFVEKNVVCPVCKNMMSLQYPNPKMYAASRRESDRRVTAYTWAQGIQTSVMPHYYAVVQCQQCLFADLKETFENPRHGPKDRLVYEARNNLEFKRVMILKKLHRLVPQGELNLDGAIAIHLSAVFNALLPGKKEEVDHNKLGRLYLRLSWLYREQRGETAPDAGENGAESVSPVLSQLDKMVEGLQSDYASLLDNLGSARGLIRERATELGLPAESEKNPYWSIVAAISDKSNELRTFLEMFQQSVISDKKGKLSAVGVADGNGDNNARKLFSEIAIQWPEMPQSEEACVRRTVASFDFSFKNEDTDHSLEQGLAVVNLIVKLLLKIGDLDGALDYAAQIFKSGFRDKQDLSRRLSQGKQAKTLSSFDEKNILRKIGTINNTLTQAGDTRKMIIELIYEKRKDKILPILKENVEKSAEEQAKAILDAGFQDDLLPFLEERGLIKKEESKKGWFGKKK